MKKIFAITLLFCAALAFAQDKTMPRFAIPTAKSSSMGGTHVAYTDNVYSLLVNPAAMVRVQQWNFFTLSPSLFNVETTGDMLELAGSLMTAGDDDSELENAFGKAADTISNKKGKISLGFDLTGFPLSIAWVANGFGIGLWDRIFVNPNIMGTNIVLHAYADVIMPFGFAFKILNTGTHDVDVGITVKPFMRALLSERINILSLMDEDSDAFDSLSVPLIMGAGLDLGFLYRWDMGLSAGLTFNDMPTGGGVVSDFAGDASGNYSVPFSMNLGVAYDFKLGKFWQTAPEFLANFGITFAIDWRDFTNVFQQDDYTRRNAALDIGLGLQFTMWDMLKIRMGLNECLPSFGLGVDLKAIEIDFAYYGKELGLEPGQMPVAVLQLAFSVRPPAKKVNWPWTRTSIVDLISGTGGYEGEGEEEYFMSIEIPEIEELFIDESEME